LSSPDCCNAQDKGNKERGEVVHQPYRFDGHKYTHVLSGHLDFLLLKKKSLLESARS
jgi:hypothetical protein